MGSIKTALKIDQQFAVSRERARWDRHTAIPYLIYGAGLFEEQGRVAANNFANAARMALVISCPPAGSVRQAQVEHGIDRRKRNRRGQDAPAKTLDEGLGPCCQ